MKFETNSAIPPVAKTKIAGLVGAANVSVSTIYPSLSGATAVRGTIMQRAQATERIGFYGRQALEDRRRRSVPNHRLGVLLQQSNRELCQIFAREMRAACHGRRDAVIEPEGTIVDLITHDTPARQLTQLAARCDTVALIAADHPLIDQAIRALHERGTPVVAYITDQSAPERAVDLGVDSWKLGRTAGRFIARTCPVPGRIAMFNGNHRCQCQNMADTGFRSELRAHAPQFVIDDTRPTHEEAEATHAMARDFPERSDALRGSSSAAAAFPACCERCARRSGNSCAASG